MSEIKPKVSVVMSVLNGESFLNPPNAVQSILNQTYQGFEFIIVDDGSTDCTWPLLQAMAQKDPRIRLLKNKKKIGLTKSLNKGLQAARGDYIARQDIDDFSYPARFQKQTKALDTNPDVVLTTCYVKNLPYQSDMWITQPSLTYEILAWELLFRNAIQGHSQVMFRRSALQGEGYSEDYPFSQDYELWVRLSGRGRFVVIPEILMEHPIHERSLSVTHSKDQETYAQDISKKALSHFLNRSITEDEFVTSRGWDTTQTRAKIWRYHQLVAALYAGFVRDRKKVSFPFQIDLVRKTILGQFLNFFRQVSFRSAPFKKLLIVFCLFFWVCWRPPHSGPRGKKILVISHDAYCGAPTLLADICRALKRRGWELSFLFLKAGPLLSEFQSIGEVMVEDFARNDGQRGFYAAVRRFWQGDHPEVKRRIREFRPDIIYANTTATCSVLPWISQWNIPVVMHVHELQRQNRGIVPNFLKEFLNIPSRYLAVSRAVQQHLEEDYKIPSAKITLAHGSIDCERVESLRFKPSAAEDFLSSPHDCVIGGAGYLAWRKGPDLWFQMATEVKDQLKGKKRVKFIWCGGPGLVPEQKIRAEFLTAEIKRLGLANDILFTGHLENPYPVYNAFDLLALTSREDPFPLVCLENMYLGKPVVCFSHSGGAPEAIRGDAGITVEKEQVSALVKAVVELVMDDEKRNAMGQIGKQRIIAEFNMARLATVVEQIFVDVLTAQKRI